MNDQNNNPSDLPPQQGKMNVNIDPARTPVLYTDAIRITANENGVVLTFAQQLDVTNQLFTVGRIGMSKEHAQKLVDHLTQVLKQRGGGTGETGKIPFQA